MKEENKLHKNIAFRFIGKTSIGWSQYSKSYNWLLLYTIYITRIKKIL